MHRQGRSGILNRHGADTSRRRLTATVVKQSQDDAPSKIVAAQIEQDDLYQGIWLYPEIMDIIALVAALSMGIAMAAFFSFPYDDMAKADARYVEFHVGRTSIWIAENETHPVSQALMTFASLSSSMSSFSLVLAVAVRSLLSYISYMPLFSKTRKYLLKWANPSAVMAVVMWTMAAILNGPVIYNIAWVIFPPQIARHAVILVSGCLTIAAIVVLFALVCYVSFVARGIGKEEEEEDGPPDFQNSSTTREGSQSSKAAAPDQNLTVKSEQENIYKGVWVLPEIMDLIALVAVLALGVSTAAMFAYSLDHIETADLHYVDHHKGQSSTWVQAGEDHPVSKALMIFGSLSSAMSSFAVVLAVAVRIGLTYALYLPLQSTKRQFLLKWGNPFAIVTIVAWTGGTILTAMILHFTAWVVFPPDVANHTLLLTSGATFVASTAGLFFFAVYIAVIAQRMATEEEEERAQKEAPTSHSSLRSSIQ